MKKRIVALMLCLVLLLCIGSQAFAGFNKKTTVVTPDMLSLTALTFGMLDFNGLGILSSYATEASLQTFMQGMMDTYAQEMQSSTIADWFTGQIIIDAVGKAVVAQDLYNKVVDFGSWLVDKLGINNISKLIGQSNDVAFSYTEIYDGSETHEISPVGFDLSLTQKTATGNAVIHVYYNGVEVTSIGQGVTIERYWIQSISARDVGTSYKAQLVIGWNNRTSTTGYVYISKNNVATQINASVPATGYEDIQAATNQAWSGGYENYFPETVQDLARKIYQELIANTFEMDSEIIDIAPAPTPVPVPPSPYPQAETELDGINTNIEQLNDMLDSAFNVEQGINDLINSGQGTVEGLNDLVGQGESVLEGIDEMIDILEGVGTAADDIADAMEAVESLTGSIDAALDIISASDAANYKFDLTTLFPFCIPFDIVRMLKSFDSVTNSPTAPHIQIPVNFGTVIGTYTFDLDFSIFDPVAAILRTAELVVFAIGLAIATSKVIKW